MPKLATRPLLATLLLTATTGCQTVPPTHTERQDLEGRAQLTVSEFREVDPGLEQFFRSSAGYAVFPKIGKGAVGVGGAYGRGVVYEGGRIVGYCDMSQATVGLQIGAQEYSEIIFFENRFVLEDFKRGHFAFAAGASAVSAEYGVSRAANYERGVLVLALSRGGLMAEASVGGQRFNYYPK